MRGLQLFAAACVFAAFALAADNPFIATWKLDAAKSKFAPGTEIKEMTITFEVAGDQVKRVAAGVMGDGESFKEDDTLAWDGKAHNINEPGMTVAVHRIGDRRLHVIVKHEDKLVNEVRVTLSSDGNTFTATEKGVDSKGRKLDNIDVFEKQ
jgi:hypothetical protein